MAARALVLLVLLSACVVGPDGRRVLSPVGERILEHVLACGAQVATAAASSGGRPSEQLLLEASRCHVELVRDQLRQPRASSEPASLEHGRLVLEAHELEAAGQHDQAKAAARACDRLAREQLRRSREAR